MEEDIGLINPNPWNVSSGTGVGVDFGKVHGYRGGYHKGIDTHAPVGEPILAAESGIVTYARDTRDDPNESGNYGIKVEIDHGEGLSTVYGHLDLLLVEIGQEVDIEQMVGTCGNTGNSDGPHLHFEVHLEGELQDPMECIKPRPEYYHGAMMRD